jgi:hypothetical protein
VLVRGRFVGCGGCRGRTYVGLSRQIYSPTAEPVLTCQFVDRESSGPTLRCTGSHLLHSSGIPPAQPVWGPSLPDSGVELGGLGPDVVDAGGRGAFNA